MASCAHKRAGKVTEVSARVSALAAAAAVGRLRPRRSIGMGWRSCNILLDENENVKICDFGLGRILGPQARCAVPT